MQTTFDRLTIDNLSRIRNEVIKQARANNSYDNLTADLMVHAVLDVLRLRGVHADVLARVISHSEFSSSLTKLDTIARGQFDNKPTSFRQMIDNIKSRLGLPSSYTLPFQA